MTLLDLQSSPVAVDSVDSQKTRADFHKFWLNIDLIDEYDSHVWIKKSSVPSSSQALTAARIASSGVTPWNGFKTVEKIQSTFTRPQTCRDRDTTTRITRCNAKAEKSVQEGLA